MIQFGGLVAIANTSLALLAVSVLWLDPMLLALLIVPLLTVFLAYRAYISEREKHERLELLYQSSRILQHSPELDSALAALLEHAREMFRAERAEVLLWPRDTEVDEGLLTVCHQDRPARMMVPVPLADADRLHRRVAHERRAFLHISPDRRDPTRNAMTAPLLGEAGLIGSMVVANRLTEGTTFSDDDLRLLETLANQAAVALENGQLEQSLAELSRLKEELRLPGLPRPADRARQPEPVRGAGRTPRSRRRTSDACRSSCSSTSTTSRSSTTRSGTPAGDRLLTAVAERVQSCVRTEDVAARLGGDEFAILLVDEPEPGRVRGRRVAADRRVRASRSRSTGRT